MAATAAVYNRLHNTSVGVVGGIGPSGGTGGTSSSGHHHQLARSLERILEEAHLSGELILTNRKLKDFPKTGTKYNLSDTVIAGKFLYQTVCRMLFLFWSFFCNEYVWQALGCGRGHMTI